jgi:hypothetical protein
MPSCLLCGLIWQQAYTLVWLDFSLPLLMTGLLKRTIVYLLRGATICKNNHEQPSRLVSQNLGFSPHLESFFARSFAR